jgi:hypothetical protein
MQAGGDVTDILKAGRDSMLKVRFNSDKWKKAVEKFTQVNAGKAGSHYNATRMLFMLLLEKVILKTPVKYGRARGGFGAAPGIVIPPANPIDGKPDQTEEGRKLSTYSETVTTGKIRMALVNGVEYIEYLESGSSLQAPFGMVRISQLELDKEIRGRALPASIEAIYAEAAAKAGMTKEAVAARARGIGRALGLLEGNA